jgi:hypothetical protein
MWCSASSKTKLAATRTRVPSRQWCEHFFWVLVTAFECRREQTPSRSCSNAPRPLIEAPRWSLTDFVDRLDAWIDLEQPDRDLRLMVTAWILTRYTDPYQGVRREPGFDNLWFGKIPRAVDLDDKQVVCSYFIFERARVVRCNDFASLSWPV